VIGRGVRVNGRLGVLQHGLEDLLARQASSVVGFVPRWHFSSLYFNPNSDLRFIGRDGPAAGRVKLQELAIEAQQILGLCRVGRAGNGVLSSGSGFRRILSPS
jgi:hypothetical protein